MITVRFAPSPTGCLHIGGARTALFNWLYARAQSGKLILRIEDTDRERSEQQFVDEIMDSLKWLGLDWDELAFQSERFDLYRDLAEDLVNQGLAYREGTAVILKMTPREVKVYDLVRGEISFDTDLIKDQVLIKSDGSPTYSFACVVDDSRMDVTHVIRGEDHISNTPKQMMIYQAMGLKPPKYAHLPLILDAEGGRMSKRTGAVAVSEYRNQGFLPEAVCNFLLLLGWSPGQNQEIISMEEALKKFSVKKINKAGAVFSMDKLRWMNGEYIKKMPPSRLSELVGVFLQRNHIVGDEYNRKWLENVVQLYQKRMPTFQDLLERADFLFGDTYSIEPDLQDRSLTAGDRTAFQLLKQRLAGLSDFECKMVEDVFRAVVDELGIKAADLVHPVRAALTGKTVGPGLFETMSVLGREKTLQRLEMALTGKR